ncbi:MAG: riboflavin synthase [Acidimicrobiia bacterium]|nr:riboflavin synthase [Acidimicrobiia bacterium]
MFTGIVTEVGSIVDVSPTDGGLRFDIKAPDTARDATIGDSIAVNGVCLTATALTGSGFVCEAIPETVERTALRDLAAGSFVNLERPLAAAGRFDGHIVQGHVDGVGTVANVVPEGASHRIRIDIPSDLARYTVEKGSVAIDGTSLTLTAVSPPLADATWIEVALIPHTLDNTVLGSRTVGDRVNIEVDILAKYAERMTEMKR